MGDIYDQFELELASLDRKYAGQPRRQMIRLFLADHGAGARDFSSRLALDLEGRRDARDLSRDEAEGTKRELQKS